MSRIWTIARREYKLYFNTPIAYIVGFVTLLVIGVIFYIVINLAAQQPGSQAPGVEFLMSWLYFPVLFFTLPALTMRLLSDEQRMGTLEILVTAPVRDWEIVVGKWLGALLFMVTVLAVTWVFPILLNRMVDPGIDQGLLMSGYLGLILVTSASVAIGVALSSFFENQVVSFISTLGALFAIFWLFGFAARAGSALVSQVFTYLSFGTHYSNTMARGVIALDDLVYFLSVTALALFIATVSLESRRWR